jgi:ribosome-binding protein aMBF1 (putative translation factor)
MAVPFMSASNARKRPQSVPSDSYPKWARHPYQPDGRRNACGPVVRKIRNQRGLSQAALAAQLQRAGWDISREMLAKIEIQQREVSDLELILLSKILAIGPDILLLLSSSAKPRERPAQAAGAGADSRRKPKG